MPSSRTSSSRPSAGGPLPRLLAVNLAAGIGVAGLMVGGLLALNPAGLRDLIMADRDGGLALALLAGGFIVTFGSAAMATAIMTLGDPAGGSQAGGTAARARTVPVAARGVRRRRLRPGSA